jgi:hypothetical protein
MGVWSIGWALCLVGPAHAAAPSFSPGAARSGIARGPVPSRPVIPGLARPQVGRGRSVARALDLEQANAAPDRYVEVSTPVAGLATTGVIREMPSIGRCPTAAERPVGRPPQLEAALDGGLALNLGSAPWPG